MKALIAYVLIYCYSVLGAIDYTQNCGSGEPDCLSYNDGCNDCNCDPDTGVQACTRRACLVQGTPYCRECEDNTYWLSFSTFQPPGYPTCSSRFLKSAIILQDNSKCACPQSHPYYVPDVGCVNEDYCDAKRPRKADVFKFKAPRQNPNCPYEYQLCTSNSDCDPGMKCDIPKSNYDTCIPMAAKFNNKCKLVTGCTNGCIDDCMGTGYGYCVPDASQCETGGCSNQLCGGPGTSGAITTCEFRCEYGCLRYQTCTTNNLGVCEWTTNAGSNRAYRNCMRQCNPDFE